jgi:hypothetical protein
MVREKEDRAKRRSKEKGKVVENESASANDSSED